MPPVCEKMFSSRPYIHMPESQLGNDAVIYGELIKENAVKISIKDKTGKAYILVDSSDKPYDTSETIGLQGLKQFFTVYRASGKLKKLSIENPDGSEAMADVIVVSSFQPALMIEGCAIDSGFAGVWTGQVTKRVGEKNFDQFKTSIRLHISVHALSSGKSFEDITQTQTRTSPVALKDGKIFQMQASIDNWNQEIHNQDGDFPNLLALGEANPFLGAQDGEIIIYRLSSMHFLGDAEFVIRFPKGTRGLSPEGMGSLSFLAPGNLIALQPKSEAQLSQHGSPAGFALDLKPPQELDYRIPCP